MFVEGMKQVGLGVGTGMGALAPTTEQELGRSSWLGPYRKMLDSPLTLKDTLSSQLHHAPAD